MFFYFCNLRAGISRLYWCRWIIISLSDRCGSVSPAGILLSCSLTNSALCVLTCLLEQTLHTDQIHPLPAAAAAAAAEVTAGQTLSSAGDTKLIVDDAVCCFNYRGESLDLCSHQNLFLNPGGNLEELLSYLTGLESSLFWQHPKHNH